MIVAVVLALSLLYVTLPLPAALPVIWPPFESTIVGVLLTTEMILPVSRCDCASRRVTVRFSVAPTLSVLDRGATLTCATAGLVTVTAAVAVCVPLVAVMVAVPALTAFTTPEELTVATPVALDDHVTPVSTLPLASFAVAATVIVPRLVLSTTPTSSVAEVGDTVTVAAAGRATVTETVPVWPSLLAFTAVVPAERAVTTPLPFTEATVDVPDVHAIVRPESWWPAASFGVAVNVATLKCVLSATPTRSVEGAGAIAMLATAGRVTVTGTFPT